MTEALLLMVAVLLSLVCGAFVAAEFSLTTVERSEVEAAVEDGVRGAPSVLRAVRRLTFQLSGAQLGVTVTNLVVGMLAEPSVARLVARPLRAAGLGPGTASSVALVLGTALSTMFLMVVGELVPKNWAISAPLAVARRVATPQRWFSAAFHPFIAHLNNTANRAVRRMGLEPAEELASARGPQELVALAEHSAREGALEADTAQLFVRTLNLAELNAVNVMTPRVQVIALDARASCEDVANATRATGLSRFPVFRGTLDTVVGVVHIKDVLTVPAANRPQHPVTALMRESLLVPETLTVDRLLDRLSGRRTMAVVVDEYGGTAGVATLEDIVEEVVGQVRDEHDPHEIPDLARAGRDPEGRTLFTADGAARTDRLGQIGLRVPEGPYETLAGLVATELGRIPEAGDRVEITGWVLEVADAAGHRAARLLLHAPPGGGPPVGGARHGPPAGPGTADGRPTDGGTADGGTADGRPTDGGTADGGTADGGPADGGPAETGARPRARREDGGRGVRRGDGGRGAQGRADRSGSDGAGDAGDAGGTGGTGGTSGTRGSGDAGDASEGPEEAS